MSGEPVTAAGRALLKHLFKRPWPAGEEYGYYHDAIAAIEAEAVAARDRELRAVIKALHWEGKAIQDEHGHWQPIEFVHRAAVLALLDPEP